MKDVKNNIVLIRLGGLVRKCFLAGAAAARRLQAMWLKRSGWQSLVSQKWRERSPIVETGMEENLDVSTLFIVKCVAHIYMKKIIGRRRKCTFLLSSCKTYLRWLCHSRRSKLSGRGVGSGALSSLQSFLSECRRAEEQHGESSVRRQC